MIGRILGFTSVILFLCLGCSATGEGVVPLGENGEDADEHLVDDRNGQAEDSQDAQDYTDLSPVQGTPVLDIIPPIEMERDPLFVDPVFSDNFGDIEIVFTGTWETGTRRDVTISYQGGCNIGNFERIMFTGELDGLEPGTHGIIWHSWDQQAGCEGSINLKIATPDEYEVFSNAFYLANVGDGRTGFVTFPQHEQGILPDDPQQIEKYEEALELLLAHPATAFVATRMGDVYEVSGPEGWIRFVRNQTNKGYVYEIVDSEGTNPIENQDPKSFSTYEEELAQGSNPMGTAAPRHDYDSSDDPRLSFIEPKNDAYPFGFERIAAFFDSPNAPNLYVNADGYSHATSWNVATHGSLNMVQSRGPFLAMGKGIEEGIVLDDAIRIVDIAPTVGALLGFPRISGVDERGVKSAFNLLKWQDGRVLAEILNKEIAKHVIVIVSDGLNKTQLDHLIETYPEDMSAFLRMKEEGVYGRYGSISNWPSNTYPSHNVIGSGIYSGHHGVLDNAFYIREAAARMSFANQLVFGAIEKGYLDPIDPPGGETLHEAVKRVFGEWEEESNDAGGYTMSIFSPSVDGADTSDLMAKDRSGKIVSWKTLMPASGAARPNISPLTSYRAMGTQSTEGLLMSQFEIVFEKGPNPIPNFTIINFMTSDTAGHHKGPHHEVMHSVMKHINHNISLIFDWLVEWGIEEDTAIIFTADHGMQLGDPERSSDPLDALDKASFDFHKNTNYSVYFN